MGRMDDMTMLRQWRKARGWTLAETSDLTGVSSSYLSLVERGEREPPAAMKVQIARGLSAKVSDLFPAPQSEAVSA
jgi:XRE family transcriptional regulator, regulator of sulfur utilization